MTFTFQSLLKETFMPVEMLGASPIASDRLARPLSPATRAGDFVFVSGQVPTNDQGEVVGMVTAKGVKVEGVALCVPANDLKLAIQDLK
jgi:enamine deaminase RidA (YjgF/YER057c/UK114 family)